MEKQTKNDWKKPEIRNLQINKTNSGSPGGIDDGTTMAIHS